MSERGIPSNAPSPEFVDERVPVTVGKTQPTMSVLKPDNIFILAIPLKKIHWNQVQIILIEAFAELTIMFYEIQQLEKKNKKSNLAEGVGSFMRRHIDSFVNGGSGKA